MSHTLKSSTMVSSVKYIRCGICYYSSCDMLNEGDANHRGPSLSLIIFSVMTLQEGQFL